MAISLTIRRLLSMQPIDLPVFHPIALRLQAMLADHNFTMEEVAKVANEDQAMATQILKIANSSSYRGRMRVETIKEAVIRLGAQQVSNLAMAASQAGLHASDNPVIDAFMREMWLHSHACALGCRWLAENTGHRLLADQAYMAGLLHDVGKLYLLKALERLTNAGVAHAALERELLMEIFTEMHVEQGVRIMEHWNLPLAYHAAVSRHHAGVCDPDDPVVTVVRLVNVASRNVGLSLSVEPPQPAQELPEAAELDMTELLLGELEVVLEDSRELAF